MLDPSAVRPLFPGAEGHAYLDAASLGLPPITAVRAVSAMAEQACRPTSGLAFSTRSLRYVGGVGGLRASIHLYNDEADLSRLLEALDEPR